MHPIAFLGSRALFQYHEVVATINGVYYILGKSGAVKKASPNLGLASSTNNKDSSLISANDVQPHKSSQPEMSQTKNSIPSHNRELANGDLLIENPSIATHITIDTRNQNNASKNHANFQHEAAGKASVSNNSLPFGYFC